MPGSRKRPEPETTDRDGIVLWVGGLIVFLVIQMADRIVAGLAAAGETLQ